MTERAKAMAHRVLGVIGLDVWEAGERLAQSNHPADHLWKEADQIFDIADRFYTEEERDGKVQ